MSANAVKADKSGRRTYIGLRHPTQAVPLSDKGIAKFYASVEAIRQRRGGNTHSHVADFRAVIESKHMRSQR